MADRMGLRIGGAFAVIFGVMSIFFGGAVLFGGEETHAAAGDVVPFVLWFNTFAGAVYIVAEGAMLLNRLAVPLAIGLALATAVVAGAFTSTSFRVGPMKPGPLARWCYA